MNRGLHDLLLNKIHKGKKLKKNSDTIEVLSELLNAGMIYENKGRYSLTEKGENVRLRGFEVHRKSRKLEKELLGYSPKKHKKNVREIILTFVFLLLILILFLWFNVEVIYEE